jgi:hypothetical protein
VVICVPAPEDIVTSMRDRLTAAGLDCTVVPAKGASAAILGSAPQPTGLGLRLIKSV